ncbi:MAG: STAS domain-containing protein [Spirochaetales bacterium]|nr:STAS domain-containing protein [Spirochaetales bacterium]
MKKIELPAELKIHNIQEVLEDITKKIGDGVVKYNVSASKLTQIDASGLQLMLVLKHELKKQNEKFQFEKISESMSTLLESYGIEINSKK